MRKAGVIGREDLAPNRRKEVLLRVVALTAQKHCEKTYLEKGVHQPRLVVSVRLLLVFLEYQSNSCRKKVDHLTSGPLGYPQHHCYISTFNPFKSLRKSEYPLNLSLAFDRVIPLGHSSSYWLGFGQCFQQC